MYVHACAHMRERMRVHAAAHLDDDMRSACTTYKDCEPTPRRKDAACVCARVRACVRACVRALREDAARVDFDCHKLYRHSSCVQICVHPFVLMSIDMR